MIIDKQEGKSKLDLCDVASLQSKQAVALGQIANVIGSVGPNEALAMIQRIVDRARPFDPAMMRLRIDDCHGNRSLIQKVHTTWRIFTPDGVERDLVYAFGHGFDHNALISDLDSAKTVDQIISVALNHMRRANDVRVEDVWERHLQNKDGHFKHISLEHLSRQ